MTLETMQGVVDELNRRDVPAVLEYPGSIQARLPSGVILVCGDVDETFDIDVCEGEFYEVLETIGSTIPRDSTDVQAIADHFACTYTEALQVAQG